MIKKGLYIIFLLSLFVSCTSTKNTKGTRLYHSINTRYNIYFNGNEAFKEALKAQNKGYQEDYSDLIYMYPVSSLPKDKQTVGGSFDRSIEKATKGIKQHSIKAKPKKKPGKSRDAKYQKFLNREEYNPFLYKCWLMMGRSQFYNGDFLTASSTFSYTARHYVSDDPKIGYEAKIWQARCYSEMGWYYEAEDLLGKINNEGLPPSLNNLFSSVYADYLIKNKEYQDAIPYLNTAIRAEKDKTQRNRMKYLRGQIYSSLGNNAMAFQSFKEVAGSTAPYPLTLSAQIRETETYTGKDPQKMINKLKKMAKSSKNKEYADQVYYALGNMYLTIPDTVLAIESYTNGAEKSTQGGMSKALCLIKLGDIYFQQREYVEAQPCYSEALGLIKKEYKDYNHVAKRSEVLDELVIHFEAVQLQDSLQQLAALPEKERMAAIDKIIEQVIKEEKEAKEKADKEEFMAQREEFDPGFGGRGKTPIGTMPTPTAGDNSFYFYNTQTVTQGKTAFQSKWGRRKLEDNWRRRSKTHSPFEENTNNQLAQTESEMQEGMPTDSLQQSGENQSDVPGELSTDNKDPKFYLQQLPLTPEDVEASNTIIKDGLYNMGLIYKDKLEDLSLAIETFNKLDTRFPDNEFLLETYYHLYLIYLRLDNREMSEYYKSLIRSEFPESDYAIAMADPNYEYNIRMMDAVQDSIYEDTYNNYLEGNVASVRTNYQLVKEKYTQTTLMPKFMFLYALSYVQTHQPEEFKLNLKDLIEKYPDADVSVLAGSILKGLLSGRQLSSDTSPMKGMIFNLRFGVGDDLSFEPDSTLQFSGEINTPHTLMLIYPTGSINENLLLYNVASFNFGNFMIKEFDLSFENFGQISMLQVQGFSSYEEISQYYKMISGEGGYTKTLDPEIIIMPISVDNYGILMKGKSLEEYVAFFEKHFGKDNPALVAKWKLKQEEEIKEAEKPIKNAGNEELTPELEDKENDDSLEKPAGTSEKQLPVQTTDSLHTDSIGIILPVIESIQDSAEIIIPKPIITEKELEEGVNKAAGTVIEGMDRVNKSINEISSDPIRGLLNIFSKKKKTKNAIDEYAEQQEKEEKARQKELKKQQKEAQKTHIEQLKREGKDWKAILEKQQEEDEAILNAKEQQEKDIVRLRLEEIRKEEEMQKALEKQKIEDKKQKEKDRAALEKEKKEAQKKKEAERKALQKQKEKERKEQLKQKEIERKAKEKARDEERKAKEKAREEARKAKEKQNKK